MLARTPSVALTLALTLGLVACSSSSFTGTAKTRAVDKNNDDDDDDDDDTADDGDTGEQGDGAKGGDGSEGGDGAGDSGTTIDKAGGDIGLDDGEALGPCAGKKKVADLAQAMKILFYAPADSHGGSSYYRGVKQALELAGYQVTVKNTIREAVAEKLDECTLWASYRQIWMWLPCKDGGDVKSMDADSITAVKAFHEAGGGLVVFTDYHWNNYGGDHCSPTDWGGSKDIATVKDLLKIEYSPVTFLAGAIANDSGYGKVMTPVGAHPLAASIGKIGNIWGTQVRTVNGKDPLHLDAEKSTALIEGTVGKHKTLALVLAAAYGYEFSVNGFPLTTTAPNGQQIHTYLCKTEAQPFVDIADHFEKTLRKNAGVALRLARALPGDETPERVPTLPELRARLADPNPITVNAALRTLASESEVGFDDILPFLEHPNFPARLGAVLAFGALWDREDTITRLLAAYRQGGKSKRLALGLARSLGALGAREALPLMEAELAGATDGELRDELRATIAQLEVSP